MTSNDDNNNYELDIEKSAELEVLSDSKITGFELDKDTLIKFKKVLEDEGVVLGTEEEYDDLISEDLLNKMLQTPTDFYILETGELAVNIDGEEHILDPKKEDKLDIAKQEEALLKKLPQIVWDINCQGIKRKQNEVISAYKLLCVNSALKGLYKDEIKELVTNYDFTNLRPFNDNGRTFLNLLNEVEEDAGSVVKFIIACCSIKIASKKQKGEKPFTGILPVQEVTWLENLSEKIAEEEANVSKLLEKEPSRLKRLQLIVDKDKAVDRIIKSEIRGNERRHVIYKISRLTSDNLDQYTKVKIKRGIRKGVGKLLEDGVIKDDDAYIYFVRKLSRRAIRYAVKQMQKSKFELVMNSDVDVSNILPKT